MPAGSNIDAAGSNRTTSHPSGGNSDPALARPPAVFIVEEDRDHEPARDKGRHLEPQSVNQHGLLELHEVEIELGGDGKPTKWEFV